MQDGQKSVSGSETTFTIFVVFPRHKPVRAIKEEFHRIAGFPSVIGCIDGTHIPITAPSHNEADYVNRKSIHSINVQITCDAAHIISNVEAKWPGSVHDWRIYHESNLSNRLQCGEFDGLLLGDRGYPCQPRLMTSYPDPEPGPQQNFNQAHCKTRARVEMTIGLLKACFQCLHHLRVTPERHVILLWHVLFFIILPLLEESNTLPYKLKTQMMTSSTCQLSRTAEQSETSYAIITAEFKSPSSPPQQ
uniref:Putative nuclease HARBI1 n=1 Tax=Amphiprion percula TaxID=161767 RepID=A0A3P8TCB9_AMPPE